MYFRIWRFRPHPHKKAEFLSTYGPDGDWARLFRLADGFNQTELLQSVSERSEYFTIDRWSDAASWARFMDSHSEAYLALDKWCAQLTIEESEVGTFETPSS